jgi:hypothetical protein
VSSEGKGDNLPDLLGVAPASYMNDEVRCWLKQVKNVKNIWPTRENKQHSLLKSRNQTKQTNLLISNSLVGYEIQCRKIKTRRVWDKSGVKVMLMTCLMELHPGASSHT